MTVSLLDLQPQLNSIEADLKRPINEVIDVTHFILGPSVEQFEREIAEYCRTCFAVRPDVWISSGTGPT